MDHFNFDAEESRDNVVTCPALTQGKRRHSGDGRVINIYQKPRFLLDWVIGHFSYPGDWILDLCSGSGTALASALSLGRHCISVESDYRQYVALQSRVLELGSTKYADDAPLDIEALEAPDDLEEPSDLEGDQEGVEGDQGGVEVGKDGEDDNDEEEE